MPILESDIAAFKVDEEVVGTESVLAIGEAVDAMA